ncbi:MAG: hypothetical protein GY796_20070 [Chloroflexi bacterium]|nr:hypothetical protein [Chloroflexota bacterium]
MTLPTIDGLIFDETEARLKITLPVKRQWVYLSIYSLLLLSWLVMFVYGLIFTWRMAFSGERFAFAFTLLLLIFLFVLFRLGRLIWRQWQFQVATREIVFVDAEMLIVRRPVSILGITNGYGWQHIRPFYYDEERHSPAFEYGHLYVLFGQGLSRPQANELIAYLNGRYFADEIG